MTRKLTEGGDPRNFNTNVFINCPFDDEYKPLLRPLLFTIVYLGKIPRIASERSDSGENRIDKICELISESHYGIHDLSRLKSENADEFYRLIRCTKFLNPRFIYQNSFDVSHSHSASSSEAQHLIPHHDKTDKNTLALLLPDIKPYLHAASSVPCWSRLVGKWQSPHSSER